jgi:hypothetical protein
MSEKYQRAPESRQVVARFYHEFATAFPNWERKPGNVPSVPGFPNGFQRLQNHQGQSALPDIVLAHTVSY